MSCKAVCTTDGWSVQLTSYSSRLALSPCLITIPTWEQGCVLCCVCVWGCAFVRLGCAAGKREHVGMVFDLDYAWAHEILMEHLNTSVHIHSFAQRARLRCTVGAHWWVGIWSEKQQWSRTDLHSLGMCGWIRLKQTDSEFGCMLGGFQRKVHLSSSPLYSGISHRNMVVYGARQQGRWWTRSVCYFTLWEEFY